ncbi:2-phospho-L-lactate transferase [Nitratireductor sp. CAU 1489]|uniref:2-phospho-L-lactate transferase n=1 Tax=Nitratireductor arenosus TaxID=2682096 RepID=A0A844QC59_9HYPH|nr:2-phospho-L-lactate transferase [Nitratireductor arenosus]MVA96224.1 2-phospho-L-lactate transferase [Nitratireductor arenosus]
MNTGRQGRRFVALCGGVGGAKLAFGLARVLGPDQLLVVVNTGDDFEHLGLPICPDLDTVLYTLAGQNNPALGWGRADESWTAYKEMQRLGGADWFQLGDKDIGLHLARRHLFDSGKTLSAVMKVLAERLGVTTPIVPMSDEPVRTMVHTDQGKLAFQEYFVGHKCAPAVRAIEFAGAANATPSPDFAAALGDPDLAGFIICPSNPFLSIDPILAIPGVRHALSRTNAPVVAVTPLIGGQAVKGPAAKILQELELPVTPMSVAARYDGFLDGFILDRRDAELSGAFPASVRVGVEQTLMVSDDDKTALADAAIAFVRRIRKGASPS